MVWGKSDDINFDTKAIMQSTVSHTQYHGCWLVIGEEGKQYLFHSTKIVNVHIGQYDNKLHTITRRPL